MRCRPNFGARIPVLTRFLDANRCPADRTRVAFVGKRYFVVPLILMVSSASAQTQKKEGHDECARDVSRYCRAQMQDGDQIILACLKQNRAKISKGCQQMLASHGQ